MLSFVLIGLAGIALGWSAQYQAKRQLTDMAHRHNETMSQVFINKLWPDFSVFVAGSAGRSATELRQTVDTLGLQAKTSGLMINTNIIKVKVYNREGLTVFSTDASQIGENKRDNPGVTAALATHATSDLTHRNQFDSFEGTRTDVDVLFSYLPIRYDGQIHGVIELYQDVTPFVQNLDQVLLEVVLGGALVMFVLYLVQLMVVRYAQGILHAQEGELRRSNKQLSHYLAPQVYQSIFDGSHQAEIRTQRKQLTVFFSDIKNFTESTAQWQPEEITLLLNSYFAEMSQIAAEYGATLDKFIGDAIVIFFGDPHTLGVRQDAVQCVRMALAMQKCMEGFGARWRNKGIFKNFEVRIGINSGFCDVGNFGSHLRMDYTIIGREVNLAARLEQAAEPGEILISSATYALVQGEIHADARVPILAKGFSHPIPVYAVHPGSMSMAPPGDSGVTLCEIPGVRVEIDIVRLTAMQKTDTAAELRRMIAKLEAVDHGDTAKGGSVLPPTSAPPWVRER